MYIACCKGHGKIVQVLLDHRVQVDVSDNVSDISCIDVKLHDTTNFIEAILVIKKINKNIMSM